MPRPHYRKSEQIPAKKTTMRVTDDVKGMIRKLATIKDESVPLGDRLRSVLLDYKNMQKKVEALVLEKEDILEALSLERMINEGIKVTVPAQNGLTIEPIVPLQGDYR
jgi:hypothetical protein